MNIIEQLKEAIKEIQKTNIFEIKEVAEYEIKKVISLIEKSGCEDNFEIKECRFGKDSILMIAVASCGIGMLFGFILSLTLF